MSSWRESNQMKFPSGHLKRNSAFVKKRAKKCMISTQGNTRMTAAGALQRAVVVRQTYGRRGAECWTKFGGAFTLRDDSAYARTAFSRAQ